MVREGEAAAFVVRAWWDDGAFRARVTYVVDTGAAPAEQTRAVAADPEEVQRHLRVWLTSIGAGPP